MTRSVLVGEFATGRRITQVPVTTIRCSVRNRHQEDRCSTPGFLMSELPPGEVA